MGNKVFIPILKKKYTISSDTTILLYPFQNGNNFGMSSQMFYGKVDSNGELIVDFSVDCMLLDMFNKIRYDKKIKTIDHFILSSKKEKLEHAPQTPEKLQSFDPEGEVYVIVSNDLFDNEKIVAWTPDSGSKIIIPSIPKRTEFILKRSDDQLPLFDDYVEKVRRCQDAAWNEAKKLRHFGEHMVEKYVPIEYTIPAGSEFILHLLELKSRVSPLNATRCFRLSKIFIDKKEILIMQSDLSKFELEDAPLRRKRKPKV